ncbi:MAG: sugar kinase [Actinomycetota bacterium]
MSFRQLVGFGEAMLRLTVRDGGAIETATSLDCSVGGAELNTCIAAVRAGMPATWVSALPDDPLARLVRRHVRANGVDAEILTVEQARLGLYFLEMAPPPRPLRITYDRKGSAFAVLDPDRIEWRTLLGPDACLVLTGITPPLGDGPRKGVEDALAAAREVGAVVALDVNYRSALWSRDEASRWVSAVLPEVDVLSAGPEDLSAVGPRAADPLAEALQRFELQAALTVSKQRVDDAMELELRVVTPDGEHHAHARAVVVDPIGAGDALFGTFLAHLPGGDVQAATEHGLSAAVTCVGLFGDALVDDPWDASEARGVVR